MKNQGTAVDLSQWKYGNKVHLRIYSIQNAEIRYGYGVLPLNRPKLGMAGDLLQWKMLK